MDSNMQAELETAPPVEPAARCQFCLQSAETARLTFVNLAAFYATFRGCGLGQHLSDSELCGWLCPYCWARASQCVRFVHRARNAEIVLTGMDMYTEAPIQDFKYYNLTRFRLENTEHARGCNIANSSASHAFVPNDKSNIPLLKPSSDEHNLTLSTSIDVPSNQTFDTKESTENSGTPVLEENQDINCDPNAMGVNNFEYRNPNPEPTAVPIISESENPKNATEDESESETSSSEVDSDMSLGPKVYRIRREDAGKNVRHRRAVFRERKVEQLKMIFIEPIRFSIKEQRDELVKKKTSQKYLKSKYKCEKCGAGHSEEDVHAAHINKWHDSSAGEFECEICRYRFQTTTLLNNHLMEHTRRWRCLKCGVVIARRTNCELHHAKCVGAVPAQCDMCGKSFLSNFHLQRHVQRTHANTRVYSCAECDASFPYRTSLKSHVAQVHRKLRPYECNICGKKSGCASSHQMHLKTHAPAVRARETYCAECDRYFKSAHTLQHHLRRSQRHVSKDTFAHVCTICSERFQEPSYLKHHVRRVHLKVKTHPCHLCDKSYYTATSLASHARNFHAPDVRTRDHVCGECGKAFLGKNHLQNHVTAVHKKERPYACNICCATFGFRSALFTHNKLKHKMQTQRGIAPDRVDAGAVSAQLPPPLPPPPDQLQLQYERHLLPCAEQ